MIEERAGVRCAEKRREEILCSEVRKNSETEALEGRHALTQGGTQDSRWRININKQRGKVKSNEMEI